MLEDLVLAAVNEARRRSEDMLRDAMSRVAGPFSGFPFV
jgi:DNA-binding protein YbaB